MTDDAEAGGSVAASERMRSSFLFSVDWIGYQDLIRKCICVDDRAGRDGLAGRRLIANAHLYADRLQAILTGEKSHRFTPFLECLQSKGRGRAPRVISKPALFDKVVLTVLKEELSGKLQLEIPFILPNERIRQIAKGYLDWCGRPALRIAKYDIRGFYDNIRHAPLFDRLNGAGIDQLKLDLIRAALRTPTLGWKEKRSEVFSNALVGVHQGLPTSNILASYYLNELDRFGKANFVSYNRYVDDILIVYEDEAALDRVHGIVKSLGLEFNEKSVRLGVLGDFEFLGYRFNNGSLTPRASSQERFLSQIFRLIRTARDEIARPAGHHRHRTDEEVRRAALFQINLKIAGAVYKNRRYGWMAYFSQVTDKSGFFKLQKIIERKVIKNLGKGILERIPLRSLVASYYDMKHHGGARFALDYEGFKTVAEKIKFLVDLGVISDGRATSYPIDEVNSLFEVHFKKELQSLDVDAGYIV